MKRQDDTRQRHRAEQVRASFAWDRVRKELEGLPEGRGLNIAHEAVDRHAAGPRRDHRALRWLGKKGEVRDYTYGQLRDLSNRFANVLKELGIGKDEEDFDAERWYRILQEQQVMEKLFMPSPIQTEELPSTMNAGNPPVSAARIIYSQPSPHAA